MSPHDADPERIKSTWLAEVEYRTTLSAIPAKVLLFLDTCHAAAGGGELVAHSSVSARQGLASAFLP